MTNEIIQVDGKFYQKAYCKLLRTDKLTKLQQCGSSEWLDYGRDKLIDDRWHWVHLYILSDEEIEEGDWFLINDTPVQYDGTTIAIKSFYKIIASTHKELLYTPEKDRDYRGSQYEAKYQLPRPSNEFIKAYCEQGGVEQVLVECKMEGIFGKNELNRYSLKVALDNTIVIKRIKEKMYTREEVIEFGRLILDTFHSEGRTKSGADRLARAKYDKWIEQNI